MLQFTPHPQLCKTIHCWFVSKQNSTWKPWVFGAGGVLQTRSQQVYGKIPQMAVLAHQGVGGGSWDSVAHAGGENISAEGVFKAKHPVKFMWIKELNTH